MVSTSRATGHDKEMYTMSYIVKAQSYNNQNVYCSYECADYRSYMQTIVAVAQDRRKGAKMRLMEVADDGSAVRFDVQHTKTSE